MAIKYVNPVGGCQEGVELSPHSHYQENILTLSILEVDIKEVKITEVEIMEVHFTEV
jgi:hypothetical protein